MDDTKYKTFWTEDACNNLTAGSDSQPEGWDPVLWIQNILDNNLKFYENQRPVLDFGCGAGRLSNLFSDQLYLGWDLNPKAVKTAKASYPEKLFVEVDVFEPIPPGIETIFAYTSLLHLDDSYILDLFSRIPTVRRVIISEIMDRGWRAKAPKTMPIFNRNPGDYKNMAAPHGFHESGLLAKPYKHYASRAASFPGLSTDITCLILSRG